MWFIVQYLSQYFIKRNIKKRRGLVGFIDGGEVGNHARFIPNILAGVYAVPADVVAAGGVGGGAIASIGL
jgi:hypothetical protein